MGPRTGRTFLLRFCLSSAAIASTGCGQTERDAAGATGERCSTGESRCNSAGLRETCTEEGAFVATDFVCAANVAVDDDVGSYCVTKTDGTYRCWEGEPMATPPEPLPDERYRRVQLARGGLVGLTEDGRLLASGIALPESLPPATTFRTTNMWGSQGVCPLATDGSFRIVLDAPDGPQRMDEIRVEEGTFRQAFCVFEGLATGVRTDGSLWVNLSSIEPTPGNDWVAVALSIWIFCGLKSSGEIQCQPSYFACPSTDPNVPCDHEPPAFPAARYRALTAIGAAVCALDEDDLLVCKRFDGLALPIDPGPYLAIEGGKNVVCGIRPDGAASCFRHGGDGTFSVEVTDFVPLVLDDP